VQLPAFMCCAQPSPNPAASMMQMRLFALPSACNLQMQRSLPVMLSFAVCMHTAEMGSDFVFLPGCSTLGQLQSGEVRLRTRVLESERADRRQAVLQGTTVGAVGAAGLANIVRLWYLQPIQSSRPCMYWAIYSWCLLIKHAPAGLDCSFVTLSQVVHCFGRPHSLVWPATRAWLGLPA
jgi:hypothetical protein